MKITGKNIIAGRLSDGEKQTFRALNPVTMQHPEGVFQCASATDAGEAVEKAAAVFPLFSERTPEERALFLEAIASEIEALGNTLIERAIAETGLTEARLTGERGRTTGQLRMFASLLREGSWVEATIETGVPERKPAPKPDIRSMLIPIGPVVVFSASNFPLAFSTAGGDTASALAAGNPVIVKGHPSHPGTSELVAQAVIRAAGAAGMPEGIFSHLNDDGYETGLALVNHPLTAAVAFTGSFSGGMALHRAAAKREKPIPVFAEMGSVNPVLLLSEALHENAEKIAAQIAASVTLGTGQFCTKPGLIIAEAGEGYRRFEAAFAKEMGNIKASVLLNARISEGYRSRIETLAKGNQVNYLIDASEALGEAGLRGRPLAATVTGERFLADSSLHEEVFGPFALLVCCYDRDEMSRVTATLGGQLTVTLFASQGDLSGNGKLLQTVREIAGRLILNGVPTGVEVCHAMQHGGPWPATTDSRFTSVGTKAIRRFVRPVSYQNWPDDLLPPELKNDNPLAILRLVDGAYSRDKV